MKMEKALLRLRPLFSLNEGNSFAPSLNCFNVLLFSTPFFFLPARRIRLSFFFSPASEFEENALFSPSLSCVEKGPDRGLISFLPFRKLGLQLPFFLPVGQDHALY